MIYLILILIISWFGSGLAAFLIGISTDWFLYKRKPDWNVIHYSTALGFMSVWVLVKSIVGGLDLLIEKKIAEREKKREDESL